MSADPASAPALAVPEHRRAPLREIRHRLLDAQHVVLTTHVNADGDGAGSEAALAAWLVGKGITATIVNPTPFPQQFRFLLPEGAAVADWGGAEAAAAVGEADTLLVLDTSEPSRIGPLADVLPRERVLVIDHHPPGTASLSDVALLDPAAAATGELLFDLLTLDDAEPPEGALVGIYVAIVTDTGSFRYSNTTPRTHLLAADLLARGIDPEAIYQRLYATVPRRRVQLLREALGALDSDPETGVAWIVVTDDVIRRLGATSEDLDGLVEYARSLEGTEIAMLFRGTPDGNTKVSFRSNGNADVNRLARAFGGGGHVKASGATIPGPPVVVVPRVLSAARGLGNENEA